MDPLARELLRAVGVIAVGGALGTVAALVAFSALERWGAWWTARRLQRRP